jgi:hypothetical protein
MQMDMQGDPFVGVKLRSNLHLAGFTEISVRSQLMLFDQSDVNALDETCNYWWRLMDSAGNELEEKGYINAETRRSTRMHLLGLKNHENAVFSYTFIQAEARN